MGIENKTKKVIDLRGSGKPMSWMNRLKLKRRKKAAEEQYTLNSQVSQYIMETYFNF